MADGNQAPEIGGLTHREAKIKAMEAVMDRFGVMEGLKQGYALVDVAALRMHKVLQLRDAPKGRDLSEAQKQSNRRLEMDIADLSSYIDAQFAGVRAYRSQSFGGPASPARAAEPGKNHAQKNYEPER